MEYPGDLRPKKSIKLSIPQALEKARGWCAVQERCFQEMRGKLWDWGVRGEDAEAVIAELITEGFLNEERFAKAFAGGKFRIKKWGRRKIVVELKKKNISEPCIRRGLAVIDEDDYLDILKGLIEKRKNEVKETNPLQRKAKIVNFLAGKGFEYDLILGLLEE